MTKLAIALVNHSGDSMDNVMEFFGKCFVRFCNNLGWVKKKLTYLNKARISSIPCLIAFELKNWEIRFKYNNIAKKPT